MSDESSVVKQYQSLIKALIPYQQENRLLEGLNKFSSRLSSRVRNILKEEVIRLTSLTDASADNSGFAEFPVMKFKHFGIPMRLDKVGQAILKKETARYLDRYTVGVFETVMNSDHYQSHIKREQQRKIVNAFSVEAQSINDIDFGADLAIRPNFTVFCAEFEKGRSCPLAALNDRGMVVETKRAPVIDGEKKTLTFTFPDVPGLIAKGNEISFELEKTEFNKSLSRFDTTFVFKADMPHKFRQKWKNFVRRSMHQFPLQHDLEIERVMQDLERDRVLSNSPWIPIFIQSDGSDFMPSFALMTSTNLDSNQGFETLNLLPSQSIFNRVMNELKQHQETFVLRGTFQTKSGTVTVAATHRELYANKLMKQFISMAMKCDDLHVMHCRLSFIKSQDKTTAFDIHDMLTSDYPELDQLSHVLFCRDISGWVGKLDVAQPDAFKPFPSSIIDNDPRQPIKIIMEADADRRAEPRYWMDKEAKVHTGLFSARPAILNDLSTTGLRVTLNSTEGFKYGDSLSVSVPELKLKKQKYRIANYDSETGVLRLCVAKERKKESKAIFSNLFESDKAFFKQRDITRHQRGIHRFLWEVSVRYLPSVAIVVTKNRHVLDRLKTVYMQDDTTDLQPFSRLGGNVPLNGFFADQENTKPTSTLLNNMLRKSLRETHIVHAVRRDDNRIIYVKEQDFLFGKVRHQISYFVEKKAVNACITQVTATKCTSSETPLTNKRLAQLSKVDIDSYEKLLAMQDAYTHVIFLSNVSSFHNCLLHFGIYPVNPG